MLRITTFLLLILLTARVNSQNLNYQKNGKLNSIEVFSNYNAGSNAITNTFVNTFYQEKYISSDLKKASIGKLEDFNSSGGDFNAGITYIHYSDSAISGGNKPSFYVSLQHRSHYDTYFSGDLFKMLFEGNIGFRGQKADLSNFSFNLWQYKVIEGGLIKEFRKGKYNITTGIGVGLLLGQQHLAISAGNTSLFTEQDGEYIDFSTNLSLNRSDSSNKGFGSVNGLGGNLHLFGKLENATGGTFSLEAYDIGLIHWNAQSIKTKVDTSLRFEGIEVANIFNFKDTAYTSTASDTAYIKSYLKKSSREGYNFILPALIQFRYEQKFNELLRLHTGLNYRFNANYLPRFYLGGSYSYYKKNYVALTASYGGYTRLNVGLELGAEFGPGFVIVAGSNYINGYFAPGSSTAQGAYINIKKYF